MVVSNSKQNFKTSTHIQNTTTMFLIPLSFIGKKYKLLCWKNKNTCRGLLFCVENLILPYFLTAALLYITFLLNNHLFLFMVGYDHDTTNIILRRNCNYSHYHLLYGCRSEDLAIHDLRQHQETVLLYCFWNV